MANAPARRRSSRQRRRFATSTATAVFSALVAAAPAHANDAVHVYAAASLEAPLSEAITRYEDRTEVNVVAVYAASGTLARQVANGAPADIILSAHPHWLDWLSEQGMALRNRRTLLTNQLALIARQDSEHGESARDRLATIADTNQRLVVGHPDHVPAGMYARQALASMSHWQALAPRLIRAQSARAVVSLVARGGDLPGIAYRTDARLDEGVHIIGLLPTRTHDPIRYEIAVIRGTQRVTEFSRWLRSDIGMRAFRNHGFDPMPQP